MVRTIDRTILAALGLATVLAGCSSGPVVDMVPTVVGGLPAGSPARPTTPPQYPAVHDMPPQRADTPLTADDQIKMEKDLKAARDRQEDAAKAAADNKAADAKPPVKNAPAAAQKPKKKKPEVKNGETTGAKTNP